MNSTTNAIAISIQDAAEGLARLSRAEDADPLARTVALDAGMRAAALAVAARVAPRLAEYPRTIQEHFAGSPAELVSTQDALVDPAAGLTFLDVIELLSDAALSCIAPRLYRGWQDRVQARRDARRITTEATGVVLDAGQRDALLAALALRNRVYALMPPLEVDSTLLDEADRAVGELLHRLGLA